MSASTLTATLVMTQSPGAGTTDSSSDIVLKGVVRVENLEDATEHIPDVLARVKPEYLVQIVCRTMHLVGAQFWV